MIEYSQSNITPEILKELTRKRDTLRAKGFKFEYDKPDTARGRAEIMAGQVALEVIGCRTCVLEAISLIDLWKKPTV